MFLHPTTSSKLFVIDSAYVHYNLFAFIVTWRCSGAHRILFFEFEYWALWQKEFPYKFHI